MALSNAEKVALHRQRVKQRLVRMFGGKCTQCGYDKCLAALGFHHRNPSTKEFGIAAGGITRKWEVVVAEAKKCTLLCANCHAEAHSMASNSMAE